MSPLRPVPSASFGTVASLDTLFAVSAGCRERMRRVEHAGRRVWVKRYDTESPSLGLRAHRLLTKIIRIPFWRPSRPLRPQEMVARELRKYAAFDAAGLAVPELVGARRATMVIADIGPSLARRLKQMRNDGAADEHDDLLVKMAHALGEVHRAGLCHGRPHPRDMALRGDRVAFFDFEEEPEAVMPLTDAQARDVWMLFLHVTSQALHPHTPSRALEAYAAVAPGETRARLAALVASMRWIIPLGRAVSRVHFGGDLRRLLSATVFLAAATMGQGASPDIAGRDDMGLQQMRAPDWDGEAGDEDFSS